MSLTITTDFDGFKRLGKEFLDALPTATQEEADAGWKCFALAYLGCVAADEAEEYQIVLLYQIIARKKMEYDIQHEMNG